jgi:rhodanese-related sulfurtransferase
MDVQNLSDKLKQGEPIYLIDVRQPWESEIASLPNSVRLPLSELPNRLSEIKPPENALVVVYCHHGIRSLSAVAYLKQTGLTNVDSLFGGIDAWSTIIDPKVPRY